MLRGSLLLFIASILSGYGLSQAAIAHLSNINLSNLSHTASRKGFAGVPFNEPATDSVPAGKTVNVLFATNEDCDLVIYGAFSGTLTKTELKYIPLVPGNYTYKAQSKANLGELEESFIVKEGGLNEIFMDLLYASDEVNQQTQNSGRSRRDSRPAKENKQVAVVTKQAANPEEFSSEPVKKAINELSSNMVLINGGSFIMGNNNAPSDDEAEHTVTISSILFGKYEVTQQQWQSIMGYNPSENKRCSSCPVENVSWEEVMKFIKKLNELSNKKFRLPTEAEWEYVAKFGGKAEIDQKGGQEEFIKATAWYFANSDKRTHPVGQKEPNAAGVYDLFGNVSEWCFDWYSPDYFKEEASQKNPEGPPLGKEKLVRGSTYNDYVGDRFRPSLRHKLKPTTKSKDLGFRLVMEVND